MRFEVLPGLPPYGPMAISFTKNEPEHREGVVVRFFPKVGEPWVGNFLGGDTHCNAVLDHPNGADVIVVASGEGVVVDPESRTIRYVLGYGIEEVIPLPLLKSVVFQEMTDFAAVTADNSGWQSPRISWDGLRNIEVRGIELLGEAYTPIQDAWIPFKLDLLTGNCADAIYQIERALFIPVSGR